MPNVVMKDLLEAGVHFGHQTKRWNPKMKPYVYGARNGIYIIDLQKTLGLARDAVEFAKKVTSEGKKVLFVGTKKQARDIVMQEAKRADQYAVTNRWLGGTLTNYSTIKASIDQLKKYNAMEESGELQAMNKKHLARISKHREKLDKNLGGIKDMRKLPGALFIIDPSKEHTAVLEANRLGIPVISVVDTNCDPTGIDFVVPGNDDAIKSIRLFCSLVAEACIEGQTKFQEKLRANEVQEEKESESATPVSRFEGHVDLASPDEAELAMKAAAEAAEGETAPEGEKA
ncbi:MAG TPA: 30S ribosomal protein S2 [Bdellovibrionota bacterium]|jgi:small subunit ribosomal protein S2